MFPQFVLRFLGADSMGVVCRHHGHIISPRGTFFPSADALAFHIRPRRPPRFFWHPVYVAEVPCTRSELGRPCRSTRNFGTVATDGDMLRASAEGSASATLLPSLDGLALACL